MTEQELLERHIALLYMHLKSLLYCQDRDIKPKIRKKLFELENPPKRMTRPRLKPSRHVDVDSSLA